MGLVVPCGDPAPVLELVKQALDEIAPFVFDAIVGDRRSAVGFGRDHRLDIGPGDLFADGVGVVTAIRKEGSRPSPRSGFIADSATVSGGGDAGRRVDGRNPAA